MTSDGSGADRLRESIVAALRRVHDPEIPVNVYDLGLIYTLDIPDEADSGDGASVKIIMTLTAPNCPVADQIVADVRRAVEGVEGVGRASVELVFEPAWGTEKMTDEARIELMAMGVDPDRAKSSLAARPTGLTVGRKPSDR